jgi:hypothetical protein
MMMWPRNIKGCNGNEISICIDQIGSPAQACSGLTHALRWHDGAECWLLSG